MWACGHVGKHSTCHVYANATCQHFKYMRVYGQQIRLKYNKNCLFFVKTRLKINDFVIFFKILLYAFLYDMQSVQTWSFVRHVFAQCCTQTYRKNI